MYGAPCDGMITATNENVKAPEVKGSLRDEQTNTFKSVSAWIPKSKPHPYGGVTCEDPEMA